MQFTIFTANCTGNAGNCSYPNKVPISNPDELKAAVAYDHVCATYKDNYRSKDNFLTSDVLVMDIDNDHTDNPEEYITAEKMDELFSDINYALVPSRHHMKAKGTKPVAPRYHVMFPIAGSDDSDAYAGMKEQLHRKYPFFDDNAIDAARFLFGCEVDAVVWHDGWLDIDDDLEQHLFPEDTDVEDITIHLSSGPILEGSRNNTMSHFAGRILKKLGICDKAKEAFKERATKCEPPLSEYELETIWNSAIKFYEKVASQDGYVAPGEYNDEFGSSFLKPEDYSDIGEAKVLSRECINKLRYTSATDYITFHGDRWHEDKQKSLGTVEDFMDNQLKDAEEAIRIAEEALISMGVSAVDVRGRTKDLPKLVPLDKMGMLYGLLGADTYKKFVMKYRNYKNIINTQNAAKPMLAIDVSELDYDPELLNTPEETYDLTKGLSGAHPHDPDDLITKVTACAPGNKGKELWEDALQLFFCKDKELIDYVQQVVGMAAIGKVYQEHMIIAYGGGANGKSTFWNTIARTLGTYSGKISAEVLTVGNKRNAKPEMAELKGKRLIIASEMEEGMRLNTAMVKNLCSTDPIQAEKKYEKPFDFIPTHTLVLYTNHLPRVSANDDGIWRRLIVIPFEAKIVGKSDIKNYADYLFENAGSAVMSWIIEGACKAIKQDFKWPLPKQVQAAINEYREQNDWFAQFVEACCEVGEDYQEKSGAFYDEYRNFCQRCGEYTRNSADFYAAVEKAGFRRKRTKTNRLVLGVRLKSEFLE